MLGARQALLSETFESSQNKCSSLQVTRTYSLYLLLACA
jgi:hypothetical protein